MIVTERDFMAQKEYYKDQMRAAQRFNLARKARQEGSTGKRIFTQTLSWVKHRVAAWSRRPEEIYETVPPSAVPQPQ
jgi:hypothetical protein